jgi:hypothetical protein
MAAPRPAAAAGRALSLTALTILGYAALGTLLLAGAFW